MRNENNTHCAVTDTVSRQVSKSYKQCLCVHENVIFSCYSWPQKMWGDRQRGGVTQIWVNFGDVWRKWEGVSTLGGDRAVSPAGGHVPPGRGSQAWHTPGARRTEPHRVNMTITVAGISHASSHCHVLVEMPDLWVGWEWVFLEDGGRVAWR